MEFLFALCLGLTFSTPFLLGVYIRNARKFPELLRVDRNKPERKAVPTGGGIFLLPAITCILATLLGNFGISLGLAILIAGFIGLIDDIKGTGIWVKVPLMMLPSIPLIVYCVSGNWTVSPPWILAVVPFVFLLPFITSFFSNAFNIISGYDGLSPGIGVVQLGTLASLAFLVNNMVMGSAALLCLLIAGILLLFNWYPSQVFPGNSGTFITGTLVPLLFIYGGFWLSLIILFIPHICEFLFKLRFRGKTEVFGVVDREGFITWRGKPKSIIHFLIGRGRLKEQDITMAFLGLEVLLATLALVLALV
ncbi:MAG: hypothetical protein N3F63_00315 [Thermoplasmata archaeon]|nr:hypothetical protein [Thermoplasmata archaeon]